KQTSERLPKNFGGMKTMGLLDRFRKPKPTLRTKPAQTTSEPRRAAIVSTQFQPGFRSSLIEEPRPEFPEGQQTSLPPPIQSGGSIQRESSVSLPAEAFNADEAFEIRIAEEAEGEDVTLLNLELLLKIENELLDLVEPAFAKEQLILPVSKQG